MWSWSASSKRMTRTLSLKPGLVEDKLADGGGFASSAEPGAGCLVPFVALAVDFCARHQHQLGFFDLALGPLRPALGWPARQHVAVEDDRHAVGPEPVGQRVDPLFVLFAIVTVADENPAHSLSVCYHFLLFKAKIRRLFSSICWIVEGHEARGRTTSRLASPWSMKGHEGSKTPRIVGPREQEGEREVDRVPRKAQGTRRLDYEEKRVD